jgi:RNase adapter protein RapZ
MNQIVVITGLSGAGRSSAADDLEDLGWFVIDNLPPSLIPKVAELASGPGVGVDRVALVVGTGPYHGEVVEALDALRATGADLRIVFLDASTEVLVRRFDSTRRRHPLAAGESVADAIEHEREVLEPVRAAADVVIDTSELNVHQLRGRIVELFGSDVPAAGMQTTVVSFGYKHGLPLDADMVVDCRFLPNPYWDERLRPMTGRDGEIREFVLTREETGEFLRRLDRLLAVLLPAYVKEGKSYLSLAFGCTGGRHRSVVIAEEVATSLRRMGFEPVVHHRDVDR